MKKLEQPQLLTHADIAEPLTVQELTGANAILYGAGHEAGPQEITAFAYYHRKRLDELIEHPAIGS